MTIPEENDPKPIPIGTTWLNLTTGKLMKWDGVEWSEVGSDRRFVEVFEGSDYQAAPFALRNGVLFHRVMRYMEGLGYVEEPGFPVREKF